jgi:bifunctional non-homologous end joining protein LigD
MSSMHQGHVQQRTLLTPHLVRLRTPEQRLRHPSWRGLRPDRTPAEARRQPALTVPAPATVEGALATPDGAWRVEVIQRDGLRSYRLLHADNVIDGLDLSAVEQLLDRGSVELGDLVEIKGKDEPTRRIGAA